MANNTYTEADLINIASRITGFGAAKSGAYSVFSGINALAGIPALPHNTDSQGLVFYTKPCLNLSYDNVIGIRKMVFLTDYGENSMGNIIRCMLSPPFMYEETSSSYVLGKTGTRSAIIDDKCAFMPITNLLLKQSPPPDMVADTYTSNEGYAKEQISFVDSKAFINNQYDLTATFQNMEGDPITSLFTTWIEYMQFVGDGTMLPYPIMILSNEIDYQTRIWRLVLDRSKTFVQDIFATGASFPTTNPIGAKFGFSRDTHLDQESKEIMINFRCIGAIYNDPILIMEFNQIVSTFNPAMSDKLRDQSMVKIKGMTPDGITLKNLFNYKMYPRIAPSMELEWYASKSDYDLITNMLTNLTISNINTNSNLGASSISSVPNWNQTLVK